MRQSVIASAIAGLILVAIASACSGAVVGSGDLETRDYDLTDFAKVEAEDAFDVVVVEGSTYAVSVTADNNVFKHLDLTKKGSTLHLRVKAGAAVTGATLEATVTMPRLDALALSDASDGRITGFKASLPLTLTLSGASSLIIDNAKTGNTAVTLSGASDLSGKLSTANVEFSLSGASDVAVRGSAADAGISASGGSDVDLESFVAENADVNLSGASNARVFVTGDLSVHLSGGSQLDYAGNPRLRGVDISGGSSLTEV